MASRRYLRRDTGVRHVFDQTRAVTLMIGAGAYLVAGVRWFCCSVVPAQPGVRGGQTCITCAGVVLLSLGRVIHGPSSPTAPRGSQSDFLHEYRGWNRPGILGRPNFLRGGSDERNPLVAFPLVLDHLRELVY